MENPIEYRWLKKFTTDLKKTKDLIEMRTCIQANIEYIGFKSFSVLTFFMNKPLVLTSYPKAWEECFIKNKYILIDPIYRNLNKIVEPTWWAEFLSEAYIKEKYQKFFSDAYNHGVNYEFSKFISTPLYFSNRLSLITLSVEKIFKWNEQHFYKEILALASQSMLLRSIELIQKNQVSYKKLTNREIECLIFAAKGKTVWETAKILGISENTIKKSLSNAMNKLNSSTKTQAVIIALMLGEIDLIDLT